MWHGAAHWLAILHSEWGEAGFVYQIRALLPTHPNTYCLWAPFLAIIDLPITQLAQLTKVLAVGQTDCYSLT